MPVTASNIKLNSLEYCKNSCESGVFNLSSLNIAALDSWTMMITRSIIFAASVEVQ